MRALPREGNILFLYLQRRNGCNFLLLPRPPFRSRSSHRHHCLRDSMSEPSHDHILPWNPYFTCYILPLSLSSLDSLFICLYIIIHFDLREKFLEKTKSNVSPFLKRMQVFPILGFFPTISLYFSVYHWSSS